MTSCFNSKGWEYIAKLIEEAVKNGSRTATVSGKYIIDTALRLPSNFTLILEDCHLRMATDAIQIFLSTGITAPRRADAPR